ncbi:hypothetical protein M406DRAFT_261933, partial [Cryphonectria parasitica EP155]
SQLLSCLKWLGDFQILACIPLTGSVPVKDVADLVGVDEAEMTSVVRMTASAGFLQEPQPGHIGHTALSSPFVTQLFYLDAIMFLGETAAPASLQMAKASRLRGRQADADWWPSAESESAGPSSASEMRTTTAFGLAFDTEQTFEEVCAARPKLQRQWPAFLRCIGDTDENMTQVLARLDWPSQGKVRIVDVGAQSTSAAQALAGLFPTLHFVVQLTETTTTRSPPLPAAAANTTTSSTGAAGDAIQAGRIIIHQRQAPGGEQPIKDADVYLLRLPSRNPHAGGAPGAAYAAYIMSELRAHLSILREHPAALFVLALRCIPQCASFSSWLSSSASSSSSSLLPADVDSLARVRELLRIQLTGYPSVVDVAELVGEIQRIGDDVGRLSVVKKLQASNSATVAVGIRYQYNQVDHSMD